MTTKCNTTALSQTEAASTNPTNERGKKVGVASKISQSRPTPLTLWSRLGAWLPWTCSNRKHLGSTALFTNTSLCQRLPQLTAERISSEFATPFCFETRDLPRRYISTKRARLLHAVGSHLTMSHSFVNSLITNTSAPVGNTPDQARHAYVLTAECFALLHDAPPYHYSHVILTVVRLAFGFPHHLEDTLWMQCLQVEMFAFLLLSTSSQEISTNKVRRIRF
jgi:hypothetical protein